MAELADALDLGSSEAIRVGSSPTTRTKNHGRFECVEVVPLIQTDHLFLSGNICRTDTNQCLSTQCCQLKVMHGAHSTIRLVTIRLPL